MKFITSILLEAAVFIVAMLIFLVGFPQINNSVAMGTISSVLLYSIPTSIVSLVLVLLLGGGGAVLGLFGGKDAAYIGGCFGLILAIFLSYAFAWWYLVNLPNWFDWYPVFTIWQSFAIIATSAMLHVLAYASNKESKQS